MVKTTISNRQALIEALALMNDEQVTALLGYATQIVKGKAPKAQPVKASAQPKTEYATPYSVGKDGKSVQIKTADGSFIPKTVFNAIKYSLKAAGATWNSDKVAWLFSSKQACNAWVKAQEARA